MNARQYQIRQARSDDWPSIARFVDATYGIGARHKGEARWLWQMAGHPHAIDQDGWLPSWIALDGDEVVGQISLQPGRAWIDGLAQDAGWIVDVMVHPAHRGAGLAHRIHAAMLDSGRTLVTLTMAEATRRVAERAGCVTLGPVEQMVRVERLSARTVSALVRQRTEPRGWLRGAGRLFAASRIGPGLLAGLAGLVLRAGQLSPATDVEDVGDLAPEDIDRLAATMRAAIPALFDRSAAFCAWRFEQAPGLRYRFARRVRDGQVLGLAVWREPDPCELAMGTLVDMLAHPDDAETIAALASHAVLRMAHCEAVVAGASHPAFVSALRQLGFRTLRRHRPTVVSRDPEVLRRFARHADAWHFTKTDHDWDQIHPIE